MFLCQIALWWLHKIQNEGVRGAIVCIAYVVAYIWSYLKLPFLPWAIDVVPIGVFFMWVGTILNQCLEKLNENRDNVKQLLISALLCVVFVAMFYISHVMLNNSYALDARQYGNIILNTIGAVSASVMIILLCSMIKKRHAYIRFIGQNSLAFYGIQAIMCGILNTIIWKIFPGMSDIFGIMISIVSLIISVLVDYVGVWLYLKLICPLWNYKN